MKYLILLILLLLFSCAEKEIDRMELSFKRFYTKISFHKSSEGIELKGPVKEVKYKKYFVDGDTAHYNVLEVDTIESLIGEHCFFFNKSGLVTQFINVPHDQVDTISKTFTGAFSDRVYSPDGLILSETVRLKKVPLKLNYDEEDMELLYKINGEFHFAGDTLRLKNKSSQNKTQRLFTFLSDDSTGVLVYHDTDSKEEIFRRIYKRGKDNLYRVNELRGIGEVQKYFDFFEEGKLKKDSLFATAKDDTVIRCKQYNDYIDPISFFEYLGSSQGKPVEVLHYRYQYDKHNNWIEKVVFSKGKAVKATRREIRYY